MPDNDTNGDEPFSFTPIAVPDPARRSARGRLRTRAAGGVAGAVVAVLLIWWVVEANTDHTPAKHTAVLPLSFGAYARADHDTSPASTGNTDLAQGPVDVTYTAPGGKQAWITLYRDPGIDLAPTSDSDLTKSALTGADVRTGAVHRYPSGKSDGDIKCADTVSGDTRGVTQCAWQDKTMGVTFVPAVGSRAVTSPSAPADLRAFLAALQIKKAKAN